jgi:hypothetical protein
MDDYYLISATLRTLCLLAFQDAQFQRRIIAQPGVLERITFWFRHSNEDLYNSALLLLHTLIDHDEIHEELIQYGIVDELVKRVLEGKHSVTAYVSDIITMVCPFSKYCWMEGEVCSQGRRID